MSVLFATMSYTARKMKKKIKTIACEEISKVNENRSKVESESVLTTHVIPIL